MRWNLSRRAWGVAAACAVALAVRLAFVLWQDPYARADETDYLAYRLQADHLLARASGPEDTFMPVGLSLWIALGRILRLPPAWLPLWQVAAGVATCALLGVAAGKIAGSAKAGAATAWLAALYPPFLYYTGFLFTEVTTAALVALAIAIAAGGLGRGRDRAVAGLALGAAAVWRTNLALVPILWVIGDVAAGGEPRNDPPDRPHGGLRGWLRRLSQRVLRRPSTRVLGWAALPIALAALRASILIGAPSGPATNGAVNFLLAHGDWTEVRLPYAGAEAPDGVRVIHFFRNRRRPEESVYQARDPAFREAPLYAEAWRSMRRRPLRALARLPPVILDGVGLGREGYYPHVFWFHRLLDGDRIMEDTRAPIGLAVVVPALVWAASRLRVRLSGASIQPGEGLLVAAIGAAFVTFALFLSEPRMRVPFDPAFLVAAVLAARAAWRVRAAQRQ